jgi:hypothetical protein
VAAISNTLLKGGMALSLGTPGLRGRVGIVLGVTAVAGAWWLLIGGGMFS